MIITCQSCSAKYQLADSKVKSTGTKVRCPRCTHTFTVFPEPEADESLSDQTEMFVRKEGLLGNQKGSEETHQKSDTNKAESSETNAPTDEDQEDHEKTEKAISNDETAFSANDEKQDKKIESHGEKSSEEDSIFQGKTAFSDESTHLIQDRPSPEEGERKDPKPEESPAQDWSSPDKEPHKEDSPSDEKQDENVRPFGDATFFEIRKQSRKSKGKKRKLAASLLAIVGILGLVYFAVEYQILDQFSFEKEAKVYEINRPEGWYSDHPRVYQDTLSHLASLPNEERNRPENRVLLGEALIINGFLNDSQDQISSGLAFTSALSVSYPDTPLGFYGNTAYALWKQDISTLKDLVERWPSAHRDDPEFQLAEVIVQADEGKFEEAFTNAKNLLSQMPHFQRATNWTLWFALRQPQAADEYLGERWLNELKENYRDYREELKKEISHWPRFFGSIDRRLGLDEPEVESPEPEPQPQPQPKQEEQSEPTSGNDANIPDQMKPVPPRPTASKGHASQNQGELPTPSEARQSQIAQEAAEMDEARKRYNEGNQYFEQGEWEEALRSYRDSLRANPNFADAYKQIGRVYKERGESDRALRSFKIYLQLQPESSDKQLVEAWISSLE